MTGRIFVIGASAGGISALSELLARLPPDFPAPLLIAQHVGPQSPGTLPRILARAGRLPASHPKSGELIAPGHIYIAPPDRHMLIRKGHISLSQGPRENHARPAVDPLFRSAALAYGPAVVATVLTGDLDDGTAGLLAVKDRGGTTIVQDPSEATAPSMPHSALHHVPIDYCLKLEEMASVFIRLAQDDPMADTSQLLGKLMEMEDRMAEGIFSIEDWSSLEQMSTPSGLNCPTCRSALYELKDPRVLRYRCRSGHAYSALSLLSAQAESREALLSSLFGALIEEASLARRVRRKPEFEDDLSLSREADARVSTLEREASQVSEWLRARSVIESRP